VYLSNPAAAPPWGAPDAALHYTANLGS